MRLSSSIRWTRNTEMRLSSSIHWTRSTEMRHMQQHTLDKEYRDEAYAAAYVGQGVRR